MVGVLKCEKLLVVYTQHFLHFEWTLEESDVRKDNRLRSPGFYMGGEASSHLEFWISEKGTPYLLLHNPICVVSGRSVVNICDKDNSSIITFHKETEHKITSDDFDFFPSWSWPSSVQYPIILSGTARASKSDFFNESKSNQENRMKELCTDFKTFFEQGINTDVVLKIDEDIIKAHKVVLEARSPVFRRMFSLEEASRNTIVISDIKPEIMKKLISFLYTAKMEESTFDELLELYCAADIYEVVSLREDCKLELLGNCRQCMPSIFFSAPLQ